MQNGPRDASDLLLYGTGTTQIAELDRLAADKTDPDAPLAAFDAAYLLGLVPSQNDPKFWDGLAQRFEQAARALRRPDQKKRARASRAAKDTEKAVQGSHVGPVNHP